jgi:mRNA-degrading endonuclease toxin of MazEF toxin-antitoxin module
VKRGEIWTAAGGVYASKPRPSLIIQDDRFDATATSPAVSDGSRPNSWSKSSG